MSAIAGGADAAYIYEEPFTIDDLQVFALWCSLVNSELNTDINTYLCSVSYGPIIKY